MKKILVSPMLAFIFCISMGGCNPSASPGENTSTPNPTGTISGGGELEDKDMQALYDRLIEDVGALYISAEKDYADHNCEDLYPKSHELTEKCSYGLEITANDEGKATFTYCLAMTEYWDYELGNAKSLLEEALRLGLEGEKKDDAEKVLTEIEETESQAPCKIGKIAFADQWFDELPLEEIALAENAKEIYANVEFDSDECDADTIEVLWKRNNEVICHHPFPREDFVNKEVIGSMYYEEGEEILPTGNYTVQIYNGGALLGEADYFYENK